MESENIINSFTKDNEEYIRSVIYEFFDKADEKILYHIVKAIQISVLKDFETLGPRVAYYIANDPVEAYIIYAKKRTLEKAQFLIECFKKDAAKTLATLSRGLDN